MPLPNPGWNVVYGEIPAASKWSQLGSNDDALAAGTGLNDAVIVNRVMAALAVKNANIDFTSFPQAAATPGYIKIGAIMIAWGTQNTVTIGAAAATEVSGTITFPTAFSAAPVCVLNPSDMGNVAGEYAFVNNTTTTTAGYWAGHTLASAAGPMTLRWIAIGLA